jgi:hypothetical protein
MRKCTNAQIHSKNTVHLVTIAANGTKLSLKRVSKLTGKYVETIRHDGQPIVWSMGLPSMLVQEQRLSVVHGPTLPLELP